MDMQQSNRKLFMPSHHENIQSLLSSLLEKATCTNSSQILTCSFLNYLGTLKEHFSIQLNDQINTILPLSAHTDKKNKTVLFQRELEKKYSLTSMRTHYCGRAVTTDLCELKLKWKYEEKHSNKHIYIYSFIYLFVLLPYFVGT